MAGRAAGRWSPLTCIGTVQLSPAGLIVHEPGEVETLVRTNLELRYEGVGELPRTNPATTADGQTSWEPRDINLSIHISTHRIILQDETSSLAGCIPLALVQTACEAGGSTLFSPRSSYKIELSTLAWGDLTLVFRGGEAKSYIQSAKDRDETLHAVLRAMKRKAWTERERQVAKEQSRASRAVASKRVGVDAIMRSNEIRHRENANLADNALGGSVDRAPVKVFGKNKSNQEDIDAFLLEATGLIKVIHKYSATIERERAAAAASAGGAEKVNQDKDTEKLVEMMENMGLQSALTKKQMGSNYHKLLSRELVDFLRRKDRLSTAGGMMTLTDVYCLFNRARGTNMISPDDLLKAVDLMQELKLGISRREFSSGVVVVQDDEFDDDVMAQKLTEMAEQSMKASKSTVGGITATDVTKILKISALLATEQLRNAEQLGFLCRDTTIEGMRFFPNLFSSGNYELCCVAR